MEPMAKRQHPPRRACKTNGAARLVKSAASAAIAEAVQHAHPNGNGSLAMTDDNEFVGEVISLIQVRPFPSFHLWRFIRPRWFDSID